MIKFANKLKWFGHLQRQFRDSITIRIVKSIIVEAVRSKMRLKKRLINIKIFYLIWI